MDKLNEKAWVGTKAQYLDKFPNGTTRQCYITDLDTFSITNENMMSALDTQKLLYENNSIFICSDSGTYDKGSLYQYKIAEDDTRSWEKIDSSSNINTILYSPSENDTDLRSVGAKLGQPVIFGRYGYVQFGIVETQWNDSSKLHASPLTLYAQTSAENKSVVSSTITEFDNLPNIGDRIELKWEDKYGHTLIENTLGWNSSMGVIKVGNNLYLLTGMCAGNGRNNIFVDVLSITPLSGTSTKFQHTITANGSITDESETYTGVIHFVKVTNNDSKYTTSDINTLFAANNGNITTCTGYLMVNNEPKMITSFIQTQINGTIIVEVPGTSGIELQMSEIIDDTVTEV